MVRRQHWAMGLPGMPKWREVEEDSRGLQGLGRDGNEGANDTMSVLPCGCPVPALIPWAVPAFPGEHRRFAPHICPMDAWLAIALEWAASVDWSPETPTMPYYHPDPPADCERHRSPIAFDMPVNDLVRMLSEMP